MEDWRKLVISEARSWLGTPYNHKARIKGVGVDCGGLLYQVYNPIFGPFAAYPNYVADWALHKENEIYLDFIKPYVKEVHSPVPGGFSLFLIGRNYSHAAIFTDRNTYIHAYGRNQQGSVVENKPGFFKFRGSKDRPAKHFDVGSIWPH